MKSANNSTKYIVSLSRPNLTYVQDFNEEKFKTKSPKNSYMPIKDALQLYKGIN